MKLRWMLEHCETVREAHDKDDLSFGTVDSWILYVISMVLKLSAGALTLNRIYLAVSPKAYISQNPLTHLAHFS